MANVSLSAEDIQTLTGTIKPAFRIVDAVARMGPILHCYFV